MLTERPHDPEPYPPSRRAADDDDHRVIKFRPRTTSAAPKPPPAPPTAPAEGLSRFERSDEPDDFRHRMIMNAAAATATVVLTAFGIWLALSIADLRKTQDCILIGRRDCAAMPAPHR